jgi:hypothetical protein
MCIKNGYQTKASREMHDAYINGWNGFSTGLTA